MAIREWAGNPHPHFSFDVDYNTYNTTGGSVGVTAGPGMQFPLVQATSLGELDSGSADDRSRKGL